MDCKHCGKLAKRISSSHTCVAFGTPIDINGFYHDHDKNSVREEWECEDGHTFTCAGFNHCWCGWTSREPDKDPTEYQKLDRPLAWKFGNGRAITNLQHIVNLQKEVEGKSPCV